MEIKINPLTTSVTKIKTPTTFYHGGTTSTELLMGVQVLQLLEDPQFMNAWAQLCNTCPWATVFQSPSFVATWYRIYGAACLPILIKTEQAGKLTGLLTLAKDNNGLITGAGLNQAEYQVWLAEDANDETFIKNALSALNRFFPRNKVLLKYIPAGVSLGFAKNDPAWSRRCFVKASPQPLMIINDDHVTNELKKKNRKEKINRLKRLGVLTFERIGDYAAFVSVFDELALQSDFRKGAMYNKVAFKTDALRKPFLLALFEQSKIHATVLKIDDKIIASNVSIWGNRQLHLQGINSFDAAYARYSPGIIHFLMLGKLLAVEGVGVFDLTPGADAYKELLATDHAEAYTLTIGNNFHRFTNRLQADLNRFVKKAAAFAGVKPGALKKQRRIIDLYKEKYRYVARLGFTAMLAGLADKFKRRSKAAKCWVVQKDSIGETAGLLNIQKGNLSNLLDFDQRDTRYSRQDFLSDAMRRLEEGAQCYTWAEDGILLGCAWLTNGKPAMTEPGKCDEVKGETFSLCKQYRHREGRKRFPLFLQSVANKLAVDNSLDKYCIVTDCHDDLAFKKAGFQQLKRPTKTKNKNVIL